MAVRAADTGRSVEADVRPGPGRLRIAHVTATFPPYLGGTGNVAYHNAHELARLGHEVHVYTADRYSDGTAVGAELDGIAVHRLWAPFRFGNAPFTPGLARLGSFDLVHLHYPFYFGAELVLLRSLLAGQPYVVTYHQDVLFAGALRIPERLHHAVVGRTILRRAARVFATSTDYARSSRLGTFMAVRPESIGVMPNGVDGRRFHPTVDGAACRARYGLGPDDRVVLFVGALDRPHYFKGVPVLLRALARLPEPEIKLLVVGDGDLRATFRREAEELGLGARVTFAGRVSDAELPSHYAATDLTVLPSTTMGEAFGVVLLEAMATGRPVVASRLPGVRSVVVDGETGLLATPGDADDLAAKIRSLLGDGARRDRMGAAGRRLVEQEYAWPRIARTLQDAYLGVLGALAATSERGPVAGIGSGGRRGG